VIVAVVFLLIAAVGHAAIWVGSMNRTHATGWPHPLVSVLTKLEFAVLTAPPIAVAFWLLYVSPESLMPWRIAAGDCPDFRGVPSAAASGLPVGENGTVPFGVPPRPSPAMLALACYLVVCWVLAAVVAIVHVRRMVLYDVSAVLRFHRGRRLRTRNVLHSPDHPHHLIVHLPGNESLKLELTERGLDVPRLPPGLEGLSIVHLSDLHFTGRVGRPFFEEVVQMSNDLDPDLVAVTGDLVDRSRYIDWLPDTLGRLKARYGVYFIFGNHDLRVDWKRMLRVLADCGLVYVGGRWLSIEVRGQPILLAGNELPWFKPAADPRTFPPRSEVPFRLMLAHSPDQLPWARRGDGDLMLAGHTHGGQIRLPLIGPIVSPSHSGVQYASGLFHIPPTILNVSRGLSGELPLRMNCPPEIIRLTLHAGRAAPSAGEQPAAVGGLETGAE